MINVKPKVTIPWRNLSEDNTRVTLNFIEGCPITPPEYYNEEWKKNNAATIKVASVLDTETTGLSHVFSEIIEIALKQFLFNKDTGEILEIVKEYQSYQQPKKMIEPEVTAITGITNEDVKGKNIDWSIVDSILSESQCVIAHNAGFDRGFVDPKSLISRERIWACSAEMVNWRKNGFPNKKLEMLAVYHGFFYSAHRAMSDVDALIYLLSLKSIHGHTYLNELLVSARRPRIKVIAKNSMFDAKDLLKMNDYKWDANGKYWTKNIFEDEWEEEKKWLLKNAYVGEFLGEVKKIPAVDVYKSIMVY